MSTAVPPARRDAARARRDRQALKVPTARPTVPPRRPASTSARTSARLRVPPAPTRPLRPQRRAPIARPTRTRPLIPHRAARAQRVPRPTAAIAPVPRRPPLGCAVEIKRLWRKTSSVSRASPAAPSPALQCAKQRPGGTRASSASTPPRTSNHAAAAWARLARPASIAHCLTRSLGQRVSRESVITLVPRGTTSRRRAASGSPKRRFRHIRGLSGQPEQQALREE